MSRTGRPVRATLPGIRVELAAAVRRVNHLYAQVPEEQWPPVDTARWRTLEDRVDAAGGAGSRARALEAIADWEHHATAAIRAELKLELGDDLGYEFGQREANVTDRGITWP
jgi:hypothetical protein